MPSGRWPPSLLGIHPQQGLWSVSPEHSSCRSLSTTPRRRGPRSPRRSRHRPPARRDWRGSVGVPRRGHRLGRPCPTAEAISRFSLGFRLQRGLQLSNPVSQRWWCQGLALGVSPRSSPVTGQGSFPPPALPGLAGTTSPSAICRGRPPTSGSAVAPELPAPGHRDRLPLSRPVLSARAATTTPVGPPSARVSLASRRRRPSPFVWRVGSHDDVS